MINLQNDYCGIAHPKVLEKLLANQNETYIGYGKDEKTAEAIKLIKNKFNAKSSYITFLAGGTITNKIAIAHFLKPYEAVICATTGHINVHETGAIEETGHKILTINSYDGKIKKDEIVKIYNMHTDEHMVKPKMVYISNPTEYGTLYTLLELKGIYEVCQKLGLYLYLDGARLGVSLTADTNDISPSDYVLYTDAFYIGGVKNGLLMGEALVINNKALQKDIRYAIKQNGALSAKGFVNGLQFCALFEDDLFFEIARYINVMASLLVEGLKKLKVSFFIPPQTNQIFINLPHNVVESLKTKIKFTIWEENPTFSIVRLVTHYLLNEDLINEALLMIEEALKNNENR